MTSVQKVFLHPHKNCYIDYQVCIILKQGGGGEGAIKAVQFKMIASQKNVLKSQGLVCKEEIQTIDQTQEKTAANHKIKQELIYFNT